MRVRGVGAAWYLSRICDPLVELIDRKKFSTRHLASRAIPCVVAVLFLLVFHPALAADGPSDQAQNASAPATTGGSISAEAAKDEYTDEDYPDEDYPEDEDTGELIADPLEGLNRGVFWFNDKLYFYAFKPVVRVYRVVPQGVRVSVSNFFSNLRAPIRVVNSGLQLKFDDAGRELLRFLINTTLGIGGLFDPAKRYGGLREKDEDFGQTLGSYGVGQGFYLVLPFLGASSARDGVGLLVDTEFNPMFFYVDDLHETIALRAVEEMNYTSLDRDTYEKIKRDSLDPYTFIKNAYAQNRIGKVAR